MSLLASISPEVSITIMADVATTLTFLSSKTTLVPNEQYTMSGRLTRNDTGVGVASQSIYLFTWNGSAWVQGLTLAITDSSGNYSRLMQAPATSVNITVRYRTQFLGATGVLSAESPETFIDITGSATAPNWMDYWPLALIAAAVGGLYLLSRKRKR